MMIQLRGPSGSGKSTCGYELLARFEHVPVYLDTWTDKDGKPIKKPKLSYYRLPGGMAVAGKYPPERGGTGGLDGFRPLDQVYGFLKDLAATEQFVYFESLMLAHCLFPVLRIADWVGKENVLFGFLDTPYETCVKRMVARIQARADKLGKVNNRESSTKSLQAQFDKMKYLKKRYDECGYNTQVIEHEDQVETVITLFRLAGWNPEADDSLLNHPDVQMPRNLS